ncbi:Sortase and related acyltransferases [[Actinomadura] parvosata subsp. kistnae]|uniref:GNAT family N-acetyltransferase n=1 Tax=[Actinomadura] parvosata subsp. kistnae TaxID=1909395 RepID=A0A1U9ZXK2_9ACTN|nr:GNAT family N-acetyltransferase [Nonomuraea sp. ATCC 55076]AQZ62691.1 GNAT family N-acetyltransferase [Nonomuraea sp. ATCC 55076]SPL88995.1 Sortase and related acyltransferases [Actinomadura parvosata subsp. kistnae]
MTGGHRARRPVTIRPGREGDVPAVLAMFDSAVAWLTEQGRTGQWGTRPFTGDARRTEQVASWLAGGGMRIAEHDGRPAGCLSVGPAHDYVPPAAEPELYVQALVTDRRHAGLGIGRALLDRAATEARGQGLGLLRVDCYAGHDGRLVAYYESCGFTRIGPFTVGEWPGMLLQRRL